MSTPDDWAAAEAAEGVTPEEAFALLGHATRLSILRTLWEAQEPFEQAGLTFTELRERTGVGDSGQFNYHLDQLVPQFVLHEDDVYRLSFRGETVLKAIVAGTVTRDPELGPATVDAACPHCGAPVSVRYLGSFTYVACTECEGNVRSELVPGLLIGFQLPAAGLRDRDPEEVLSATLSYELNRFDTRRDGVCPDCGGRVETWLDVCESHPETGFCDACLGRDAVRVRWLCTVCRDESWGPAYALLLHHPATTAFLRDHGATAERSDWAFIALGGQVTEAVESVDPVRVRYTLDYNGANLSMTFDGDGALCSMDA